MNDPDWIPYLPESAPFTVEQRAWLNGFLAGLFSRMPANGTSEGESRRSETPALTPLTILFGSQTGNAESLARRVAKQAGQRGFAPTLCDTGTYPVSQLPSEQRLLIVTSTFGDGEPPDNAKALWDSLNGPGAPRLPKLRFSVCALGDSNYPKFCGFGKEMDARLEALGAKRVFARQDCDVDCEDVFARWLDGALAAIVETDADSSSPQEKEKSDRSEIGLEPIHSRPAPPASRMCVSEVPPAVPSLVEGVPLSAEAGVGTDFRSSFSRSNPFPAPLSANRRLNSPGSQKDTRHFEIDLRGSGLMYEPGDALGVVPSNCPELVDELLGALHFAGGEAVPGREGVVPVREAFLHHYEITKIPPPFLRIMAERTGDELLTRMGSPGVNGDLTEFLRGREIIDLLLAHRDVRFTPIEFVGLLRKLNPRLYSISSSPKTCAGHVHVTVNVVRYESFSRRRKGVCSTFLAERVPLPATVPVFVHINRNFRPPANPDVPMIMVGPGTGVAPFRGFLQDRAAIGARGRHWLFYGDQRSETDFMYRDEIESMLRAGTLTRLDTAFSRDQPDKIYVQDRMREQARELFAWLEEGAHFYVCGDASRMAKDVDAALHEVVRTGGGLTPDRAGEYVSRMKSGKRYQRDVY